MPTRGWRLRLQDVIDAGGEIAGFIAGLDGQSFAGDKRTVSAVLYQLTVIGEAVSQVPEELRLRHPGVDWVGARRMRNFLVHAYFATNVEIVWQTARDDVPTLVAALRRVLEAEGGDDS
ncbi:MAG: DUF86 domain-containing protein [Deltaproteobacteria bacterium]|nr:DUF86 domain-containing protein [Deltaproteobacteria bacterium]